MSEKEPTTFVVNDRRKFNLDGELRDPSAHREPETSAATESAAAAPIPEAPPAIVEDQPATPPPPSADEIAKVKAAYDSMSERFELMLRASNPGGEHAPPMSFERLVQSLYMTAMMQLGYSGQPTEQPRIDILGARQTIEMLRVLEEKSVNNISADENILIQSALLELRMGFLEVSQMIARQAQAKQQQAGASSMPGGPMPGGPKLVR